MKALEVILENVAQIFAIGLVCVCLVFLVRSFFKISAK